MAIPRPSLMGAEYDQLIAGISRRVAHRAARGPLPKPTPVKVTPELEEAGRKATANIIARVRAREPRPKPRMKAPARPAPQMPT